MAAPGGSGDWPKVRQLESTGLGLPTCHLWPPQPQSQLPPLESQPLSGPGGSPLSATAEPSPQHTLKQAWLRAGVSRHQLRCSVKQKPPQIPEHPRSRPALACPWGQCPPLPGLLGLTGACTSPHPPPRPCPAHLPNSTAFMATVLHCDSRQTALWGTEQTEQTAPSSHHPRLGPSLGKSRVPRRENADMMAAEAPGLSLNNGDSGHLSASRILKGTAPPTAGDKGTQRGQAPAVSGPALGCLAWRRDPALQLPTDWPLTNSGVSLPVTSSPSSLWGPWPQARSP